MRYAIAVFATVVLLNSGGCDILQSLVATRGAIGQVTAMAEIDLIVHAVEDPFVPTHEPLAPELANGSERYVSIEVELRNERGASIAYSPNWFFLYDREGRAFPNKNHDDRVKGPRLLEGEVKRGDVVRGWITFPILAESRLHYLQFFEGHLDGKPAHISLRE